MSNPYFDEYENLEVHELMLKDRPRQIAYWQCHSGQQRHIKDKSCIRCWCWYWDTFQLSVQRQEPGWSMP
ncbi:GL20541 [Drosophila persimilis]|uniref:GL20541 n=1 Tax=Drosophila persimilis TaxID=7234 RepID=B4G764_DROPE|nr:GL20541 [Drosophila persimilis]